MSPRRAGACLPALLWSLLAVLQLWGTPPLSAQPGEGPAPVGFTEARAHLLQRSVTLTGTVEARRTSVVASEVAGLVVELAAREGDLVRRGGTLVRLRRENLELTLRARQADLKEAEARLELARTTRQRRQELFESDVISRQTLDDAVSEEAAWEGRAENLQAEIDRVEDDLERSVVRAPFTGVVVEERTQVGEWIGVGGPAVELLDVEELEVELEVPERWYVQLSRGAPVRVAFEALPELEVEGRVGALIPRADPQARTFPVKVRFANRDPAGSSRRAAVGMLARVALPVGEASEVVIVPKDALVRQGGGERVYRLTPEGTVEPVSVTRGAGSGAWVEVRGPVETGDRVVTRGNERLRPGQEVEGRPVGYPDPEPVQVDIAQPSKGG